MYDYFTMSDRLLTYKKTYTAKLNEFVSLQKVFSFIARYDPEVIGKDYILSSTEYAELKEAFLALPSMSITLPSTGKIYNLYPKEVFGSQSGVGIYNKVNGVESFVASIRSSQRKLQLGQAIGSIDGETINFMDFISDVSASIASTNLIVDTVDYVLHPDSDFNGISAIIQQTSLSALEPVRAVCDKLKSYFLGYRNTQEAMMMFISDQVGILSKLQPSDNDRIVDGFSEDYIIATTVSVPVRMIATTASLFISGIISVFSPITGAMFAGLTLVGSKIVDFIKENLSTSSVVYAEEFDTPSYAQSIFQYRQKQKDSGNVDFNAIITAAGVDDTQPAWMIKVYWYSLCFYIWKEREIYYIEGFIIPLWYPVRDGGGNYIDNDTINPVDEAHTLSAFLSKLATSNIPFKIKKDEAKVPYFFLQNTTVAKETLDDLWTGGYISPTDFAALDQWQQVEAIKQSMFWLGLVASPNLAFGTTEWTSPDILWDPSQLYSDKRSFQKNTWKLAFSMFMDAIMVWDYSVESLNPSFTINRSWDVINNFKTLQEYMIAFKDDFSKASQVREIGFNSSTSMLSKYNSVFNLFSSTNGSAYIDTPRGRGNHLVYPPQFTVGAIINLALLIIGTVAIGAATVAIAKTAKRWIRVASYKQTQKLKAEKAAIDEAAAAGNFNASATYTYLKHVDKHNKWAKAFSLSQYDAFNAVANDPNNAAGWMNRYAENNKTISSYTKQILKVITGKE